MTPSLYQFQVSLFKGEHHLLNFAWTDDKDAVIEAMDSINSGTCRDLRAVTSEHDYRRHVLKLVKNGHVLLVSDPYDVKASPSWVVESIMTLVSRDRNKLRASVITRGNGGISLPDSGISIGA